MGRFSGRLLSVLGAGVLVPIAGLSDRAAADFIFEETMGPSLELTTPEVSGQTPGEKFIVWKFVFNESGVNWLDFHINLEVQGADGVFGKSGEGDGISFNQPKPFDEWALDVFVDINGVDQGPAGGTWNVMRENIPFDTIWFTFKDFTVRPDDILSLHFTMLDFNANTWRLHQTATIPGPATLALLTLGGLITKRRRRR